MKSTYVHSGAPWLILAHRAGDPRVVTRLHGKYGGCGSEEGLAGQELRGAGVCGRADAFERSGRRDEGRHISIGAAVKISQFR